LTSREYPANIAITMAVERGVVRPDHLATMPLFAGLKPEELERVAELAERFAVPAGETIGSEHDFAYEFFIIEEGRAEVVRRDGSRLAELGPGDFFGEIGLLITGRRTASVVSLTPMRRIVMFEQSFRRVHDELPTLAASIRAVCADRFQRR